MKSLKIASLILLISFAFKAPVFSQAAGPGGGAAGPGAAAPIDGGLSLLLAAGIGYGAKKLYQNRHKKQAETID